jgi:hypothetical protein
MLSRCYHAPPVMSHTCLVYLAISEEMASHKPSCAGRSPLSTVNALILPQHTLAAPLSQPDSAFPPLTPGSRAPLMTASAC